MKEHIKKHKKQYLFGVIILALILILFIVILITSSDSDSVRGSLELKLEKKSIESGEKTYLLVSAKNTGKERIEAEFEVYADDISSVSISYPAPELLKFSLLPGEGIERRLEVTATSKAVRTDYEITANMLSINNTILSSKTTVLTVKRGNASPAENVPVNESG